MIGIVVISHGSLAHAMIESAKFFLDEIDQILSVELRLDDEPYEFGKKILNSCYKVDTGDGVVILADLFGGTPCNQSCLFMTENIHVLSGCNLAMLLELCTMRFQSDINLDTLVDTVKEGICHMNSYSESINDTEEYDE